jgi:fructose-specific component phosphotransferase system IIB-like protein
MPHILNNGSLILASSDLYGCTVFVGKVMESVVKPDRVFA